MAIDRGRSAAGAALRPAAPSDVDAVARIWNDGWPDGHRGNVPAELLRYRTLRSFRERTLQRVDQTWVATVDDLVVGFVVVADAEIEQIYLAAEHRGSGIAALLLERGCSEIAQAGHARAWLAVVAGNSRARAFYGRQGWRDDGPLDYRAQAGARTVIIPVHRYSLDLQC